MLTTPLREGQIVDYICAIASRYICAEISRHGALLVALTSPRVGDALYVQESDARSYRVVRGYESHERVIHAVYRLGGAPAVVRFLKTL